MSVIQLDVEGFEQPALSGALRTIERCRPVLVLETVPDADWVARHLAPFAYRVVGSVHENTVLAPPARPRAAARGRRVNAGTVRRLTPVAAPV